MSKKLMIVDDSNVIRNRITRGSSRMDLDVVATATNGLEAVEMYKQFRPDVECIYELTNIDENANILVISALSDKATGIKALQLGARGFICKPFTDEDLFEALEEMLEEGA